MKYFYLGQKFGFLFVIVFNELNYTFDKYTFVEPRKKHRIKAFYECSFYELIKIHCSCSVEINMVLPQEVTQQRKVLFINTINKILE